MYYTTERYSDFSEANYVATGTASTSSPKKLIYKSENKNKLFFSENVPSQ